MNKGFMMRIVNSGAQDRHAFHFRVCLVGITSCNITNSRSDDRYFISPRSEQARKFMVTCATGFIDGCKCLVNDEDVHGRVGMSLRGAYFATKQSPR